MQKPKEACVCVYVGKSFMILNKAVRDCSTEKIIFEEYRVRAVELSGERLFRREEQV